MPSRILHILTALLISFVLMGATPSAAQRDSIPIRSDSLLQEVNNQLWRAVEDGDLEAAQLALDSGASVNMQLEDGETLLMRSVRNQHPLIFELLIARDADIHLRDNDGETVLWDAIWIKNELIFDQLIRLGANLDDTNSTGDHLLAFAADLGRYTYLRKILSKDVDVDISVKNPAGYTALMLAIRKKSLPCAQLLIEHGANLEARTEAGQTPLSVAVQTSDSTIVRLLLDHDAEVNAADNVGRTPLMYCLLEVCKTVEAVMLIAAGADPSLRDSYGKSAYDYAEENNCPLGKP